MFAHCICATQKLAVTDSFSQPVRDSILWTICPGFQPAAPIVRVFRANSVSKLYSPTV